MAKHTPGPWESKPKPNDRLKRFMVLCMNEQRCPGTGKELVADNIRTAETAELIAAAPEMLSALRELVSQRDAHFHTADAWDAARAAIAKAEGTSNA